MPKRLRVHALHDGFLFTGSRASSGPPLEGCPAFAVKFWAAFFLIEILFTSPVILTFCIPKGNWNFFPTKFFFNSVALAGDLPPVRVREDGAIEVLINSYTREETPKENVAANITVVAREEIEKIPATNAAEVLQFIPGVYIEFNGGLGSQATASIQGSSFSPAPEVAVYQDGVPLNMLANPVTNLSLIPLSSIERIEVYKGAASSAWGTAMGGVINIITKNPLPNKPFGGKIKSSYGNFNNFRNSGSVTGTVDRFGYFVSFDHDETNGFTPHTSFRQDAVYAKINYFVGESSRLNFVVNHSEGRRESPSALLTGRFDFWEQFDHNRTYERLLYETKFSNNIIFTIEARHQEFQLFNDRLFDLKPSQKGWDHTEELYGISSRLSHNFTDKNLLVLGFDGDWGEFSYSLYDRDYPTQNLAVYANDTLTIGSFSLTSGVRFDNNLEFGAEISPMGGVVFRLPWYETIIRAQVAKGFAAPPPGLINDPTVGNKNLSSETAINYQLGCEIHPMKYLKLELNLFKSAIDNFIAFDQAAFKWNNVESVKRQGGEASISTNIPIGPSNNLGFSLGGIFVDVKNERTGNVLRDVPRQILYLSASHNYKQLTQSITGKDIDNNSISPETRDEIFVLDYLARLRLPSPGMGLSTSVFFAVHNITNAPYVFRAVFPQPGRWIEGGVACEF